MAPSILTSQSIHTHTHTTMNTYQLYTSLDTRVDANAIYWAVETSTHKWCNTNHRLAEAECFLRGDRFAGDVFFRYAFSEVLTEEVLRAIRSAALSIRHDVRSEEYRIKNANRLINEVDEALEATEARKAEGESSAHLVFEFGFHHCR